MNKRILIPGFNSKGQKMCTRCHHYKNRKDFRLMYNDLGSCHDKYCKACRMDLSGIYSRKKRILKYNTGKEPALFPRIPAKRASLKRKSISVTVSLRDLKVIAMALNTLCRDSWLCPGVEMNTFHFTRFNSRNHYIDYNEIRKYFRVYKKYKGWEPSRETK